MAVRREYVADLYRNILGREGSDGEIEGHLNNPGGEQGLYDLFSSVAGGGRDGRTNEATTGSQQQQQYQSGGSEAVTDSPYQVQGDPTFPGGGGIYTDPGVNTGGGTRSVVQTLSAYDDRGRAKSGLGDVYKQALGRSASDAELENWLSGRYGHGTGPGDYDKFVAAIMGSDEARKYRPAAPSGDYKSLEYWQSQGVPTGDIFDATTGQIRPGWRRTANGYERDNVGAAYTGFNTRGNDYSAFNTGRQQDPKKSAKDAFAMLSNQAPPPPMHDKRALNAWFKQHVQPGMDALGHKVLSSDDDGFTYTNHEGTFRVDYAQNAGAPAGSMLQRLQWGATPADAATAARYATGTSGTSGGGTSGGTGARAAGATQRTGAGSTVGDLRSLYQSLGQEFGGPGGAGITNGPLQQVGQDPLSYLLTGALAKFIGDEGRTSFGGDVESALAGLLERGGELPRDQMNSRYESARELLDKGRRTMINDMRGDLANRNLLSEPGIPQGAEIGGLNRITEKLAPEFSRALRDIYTDESAKSDARMLTSLQLATGYSTDQARNLLAGIGEGTARQVALSDLALRSLQTNMAWSQFLAEFGLKRDQVMYEMQNGNIEQILPLLQAFMQLGGMSNNGYV